MSKSCIGIRSRTCTPTACIPCKGRLRKYPDYPCTLHTSLCRSCSAPPFRSVSLDFFYSGSTVSIARPCPLPTLGTTASITNRYLRSALITLFHGNAGGSLVPPRSGNRSLERPLTRLAIVKEGPYSPTVLPNFFSFSTCQHCYAPSPQVAITTPLSKISTSLLSGNLSHFSASLSQKYRSLPSRKKREPSML